MLGILCLSFFNCDTGGGGGGSPNNNTPNPTPTPTTFYNWPLEFTPYPASSSAGAGIQGVFDKNNDERPTIDFRTVNAGIANSSFIYAPAGSQSFFIFDLIAINGKKFEIQGCDEWGELDPSGQKYILCTDYTLVNGVLTLTGGNFPDVSDAVWYLRNK